MSFATVLRGPSRAATRNAATILAPVEVSAKIAPSQTLGHRLGLIGRDRQNFRHLVGSPERRQSHKAR